VIIPVIMAGGVGSRLWPVSRKLYPKQFVSFQKDAPSLFQQSLVRLQGLDDVGPAIVVCNEEHRFLAAEQLRHLGIENETIILEPVGRNTAPAVALAALAAREQDENATLLVLAADHLINDVPAFHRAIGAGIIQAEAGALVTFGIVPDCPETGYGYIRRGEAAQDGFAVDRFVEKPDLDTAREYLESGEYYWNSGMFMFTAATYLQALEDFAPEILSVCSRAWAAAKDGYDFKHIPAEIFKICPSDSIDYAVMEHTRQGVVIPLDAGWNDLGAWSAMHAHHDSDEQGNVTRGDVILNDVKDSYIHADSRLVTLIGMEDAVVIETADAVLVSSRDRVQDVKVIVDSIKASGRPEADSHVRVYRPWGSYESLATGPGYQAKRLRLNPGAAISLQLHHQRAENWVVAQGSARVTVDDDVMILQVKQSVHIPVGARHRLENPGPGELVIIEVQCGDYLGEDDIVRFDDVYGRVKS